VEAEDIASIDVEGDKGALKGVCKNLCISPLDELELGIQVRSLDAIDGRTGGTTFSHRRATQTASSGSNRDDANPTRECSLTSVKANPRLSRVATDEQFECQILPDFGSERRVWAQLGDLSRHGRKDRLFEDSMSFAISTQASEREIEVFGVKRREPGESAFLVEIGDVENVLEELTFIDLDRRQLLATALEDLGAHVQQLLCVEISIHDRRFSPRADATLVPR
jgi:hypothetical protein